MAVKCLPKYLLIEPQPSTPTSRGLVPTSRGLVDTCVEGWISLIRFSQAEKTEFGRGCRYFFLNCSKERVRNRAKKVKKRIGITIGTSVYTLYCPAVEMAA
jgi:hypothetical protein